MFCVSLKMINILWKNNVSILKQVVREAQKWYASFSTAKQFLSY